MRHPSWRTWKRPTPSMRTSRRRWTRTWPDEVRRFINGEIDEEGNQLTTVNDSGKTVLISDPSRGPTSLQGIHLTPDTKRLYPFGSLAGNVLGFVKRHGHRRLRPGGRL